MTRVVVVGLPRSGTTWVAQVLCAAFGAAYVDEPDNHFRFAYAYRAKRKLRRGPYPEVAAADEDLAETEFAALWHHAFAAGRLRAEQRLSRRLANRLVARAGGRAVDTLDGDSPGGSLVLAQRLAVPERASQSSPIVVVKSVYAPLCTGWISSRYDARTVVVVRRTLEVVASWVALGWLRSRAPDPLSSVPPELIERLAARHAVGGPPATRLGRATWLIEAFQRELAVSAQRSPQWAYVTHERLYRSPLEEFPLLASVVGIPWTSAGDRAVAAGRRPGKGYDTNRVTSQLDDAWQGRLTGEEASEITRVVESFARLQ